MLVLEYICNGFLKHPQMIRIGGGKVEILSIGVRVVLYYFFAHLKPHNLVSSSNVVIEQSES